MITIILSHPWHGSYNKALLDATVAGITAQHKEYTIIDLYKDGFNPVMTEGELALFAKGESTDPLVQKYQDILKRSTELVLLFPIWWSSPPAMLKGFFDKVFLPHFAYEEGKMGLLIGLLPNIEKATVVTTAAGPKWYLRFFCGNPVAGTVRRVLVSIGVKKFQWLHCGNVKSVSPTQRQKLLERLGKRNY